MTDQERRAGGRPSRRPGRSTSTTVVTAIAVTGLGMLPPWLIAAMAVDIQRELQFGSTGLGIAIASFSLVSAVGSMPGGSFVQRHGWRAGVLSSVALLALAMVGIAAFAHSWVVLIAILAVGGLGCALSAPAANVGLARVIRPERQGLAFGLKQAAIPAASLAAGLAVPTVAVVAGWRWAFVLGAVAALLLVPFVPRRTDTGATRVRLREARAGIRPLVVLALGAGLGTAVTHSVGSFLVVSTVDRGFEPQTAGALLAGGSALSVATRTAAGWYADRRSGPYFPLVAGMMAVGAVGIIGLAVGGGPLVLVTATAVAFIFGWSWNGLFDFALIRQIPEVAAGATGVVQTGKFVGGVAGPALFGVTADHLGFAVAWTASAAVMFAAAVSVLVGRRLLRTALFG